MKTIKWIFSITIVALAISCQQPSAEQIVAATEPTTATPAPDHSSLVNSFLAAMDANDSVALFANCTADFVVYHPNYPNPLDCASFMNHIRAINATLSGARHVAIETISTADAAATRGTVKGKHTGVFNGLQPTNNDVIADWLSFMKLDENGKAKALYVQFNQIAFMAQLGAKMPGS